MPGYREQMPAADAFIEELDEDVTNFGVRVTNDFSVEARMAARLAAPATSLNDEGGPSAASTPAVPTSIAADELGLPGASMRGHVLGAAALSSALPLPPRLAHLLSPLL